MSDATLSLFEQLQDFTSRRPADTSERKAAVVALRALIKDLQPLLDEGLESQHGVVHRLIRVGQEIDQIANALAQEPTSYSHGDLRQAINATLSVKRVSPDATHKELAVLCETALLHRVIQAPPQLDDLAACILRQAMLDYQRFGCFHFRD